MMFNAFGREKSFVEKLCLFGERGIPKGFKKRNKSGIGFPESPQIQPCLFIYLTVPHEVN